MDRWTPNTEGADFEFSPILKPLEPFRHYLNVVSGLDTKRQTHGGPFAEPDHLAQRRSAQAHAGRRRLCGCHGRPDRRPAHRPGHAAAVAGTRNRRPLRTDRRLRSRLWLHLHEYALVADAHDAAAHGDQPAQSFRAHVRPGRHAAERVCATQQDRSILDWLHAAGGRPATKLGAQDRATVNDYLESVREIERRIQRTGIEQHGIRITVPPIAGWYPVFLRRPRQADVRPAGARVSGQHHAGDHLHGGARNQQPDVSAGRCAGRSSRYVAPPESRGKNGQERQNPDLSHLHCFREFLEKCCTTRPMEMARCSIIRSCSTAAT